MARAPIDLTGKKFGLLTAVRPTEERRGNSVVWECLCDCGETKLITAKVLNTGHTKSCGCLQKEQMSKDLTGQKFGLLTAVSPTGERRGDSVVWECLCDCGKTAFISAKGLVSGRTQSCGCVPFKDLTGQKFGKLIAIRPTEERKNNSVVWECLCDCGNTTFVSEGALNSGSTQSCGCLHKELVSVDLTGKKFGRLTAIRPTGDRREDSVIWECLCDCGNTKFVPVRQLTSGITQSCGCFHKEQISKDLTGQKFGLLTAIRPTDERRAKSIVWECLCDCGNTKFVPTRQLMSGITKSCGCLRRKEQVSKDLTGQKFGLLTAVRPTEERRGDSVVWECLCDCGNTKFVPTKQLMSGITKSCGCLRRKKTV